jgi:hypothetical protein
MLLYVALKSGIIIRFNPEKASFGFNHEGYFSADVAMHLPQTQRPGETEITSFKDVQSFTFHKSEMSCQWAEY